MEQTIMFTIYFKNGQHEYFCKSEELLKQIYDELQNDTNDFIKVTVPCGQPYEHEIFFRKSEISYIKHYFDFKE